MRSCGAAMTDSDQPWEPPLAGTELEHLVDALDRLRTTFRWKADDLDAAGLQTRIGSSTLTLGGLLEHLAAVEEHVVTTRLSGQPSGAPWDGGNDWPFTFAGDDPPSSSTRSGTVPSNGPVRGPTRPWRTADSTSWSTSLRPTAAMPACAGCSAT
jgi:hypothetical protein